jgi:hypothetical protein
LMAVVTPLDFPRCGDDLCQLGPESGHVDDEPGGCLLLRLGRGRAAREAVQYDPCFNPPEGTAIQPEPRPTEAQRELRVQDSRAEPSRRDFLYSARKLDAKKALRRVDM